MCGTLKKFTIWYLKLNAKVKMYLVYLNRLRLV